MTPPLLVASGCERTSGDASWAAHAAEALGARLVDLAEPGSANDRIVRTTVGALHHRLAAAGADPSEATVVVMFTALDRCEGPARSRRDRAGGRRWRTIDRDSRRDAQAAAWFDELQHPVSDLTTVLLGAALLGTWLHGLGARPVLALAEPWPPVPELDAVVDRYAERIAPVWLPGGALATWPATALSCAPSASAWAHDVLVPHLRRPR